MLNDTITEQEKQNLLKLFNLYWMAYRSGLAYTTEIVWVTTLYELHHSNADYKVVIGTKDKDGHSLQYGYNDTIDLAWNDGDTDHSMSIPASYLTASILTMLYKHSPEFVDNSYHYVSQTQTHEDEEIFEGLCEIRQESVTHSLYMLRGNNDIFESARTKWRRFLKDTGRG